MTRALLPRIALFVFVGLVLAYLILPVLIIVPMSFSGTRFLAFPPPSLSLRWYVEYFGNRNWMQATGVSLAVAASTVVVATPLGVAAAYAISYSQLRLMRAIHLVLMLPLAAGMLPPVREVTARVASVLSAPQMALPAMPVPPLPKIAAPQHPRAVSPIITPAPHQIALTRIDTDVGVILNAPPSFPAEATAEIATDEEPPVCRRPENLPGTHLPGPTVCLPQSAWGKWKKEGLALAPDGRTLVGNYEKRRSIDAPGCPTPNLVGSATTGMGSLFSICY